MELSWKTLLALAVVFASSLLLATVMPTSEVIRAAAATPGIAALIYAVFVIVRDHAAHERAVALRRDDQQFQVGAMSHMSKVVFDKHVMFCEEYMAEVNRTIENLIRAHATLDAVGHANNLAGIRVRHATWVTAAMSGRLSGFEDVVRQMGAKAHFVTTTTGDPRYAEQRSAAIDFVYREFERVMPQLFSKAGEEGVSVESIQQRVRALLGIEELVELRAKLVRRAHEALQS